MPVSQKYNKINLTKNFEGVLRMSELDFAKVGLKMKQLRVEQGYTQEMVAEDLDCTVAFVSNLENNRAKLNLRVLLYYSKLCNVTIDEILEPGFTDRTPQEANKAMNTELLRIFQGYWGREAETASLRFFRIFYYFF